MTGFSVEVPAEVLEAIVAEVTARVVEELRAADDRSWPEWMSVETAARYLDVSPERVRKLQARRDIPYCQEARGCRVLFRRRDLDDWMASYEQPARLRRSGQ